MLSQRSARVFLALPALLAFVAARPAAAQTVLDYTETGTLDYTVPLGADRPTIFITGPYRNFGHGTVGATPFYATSSLFFLGQPTPHDIGNFFFQAGDTPYFTKVIGGLGGTLSNGTFSNGTYTADITSLAGSGPAFADFTAKSTGTLTISGLPSSRTPGTRETSFTSTLHLVSPPAAAVPEPSTLALLSLGALPLGLAARRRTTRGKRRGV